MAEPLKESLAFVAEYLSQLPLGGKPTGLLVALRQMVQARGGVHAITKKAKLNTNQLYRTLSPQNNSELRGLSAVLKALDLRLAVQPIGQHRATA